MSCLRVDVCGTATHDQVTSRNRPLIPALRHDDLLVDELAGLARAYAESQAFVSLLAHELRTRLRVTERALSSPANDVEAALENTRVMQDLSETLLELARGNVGEPTDAGVALRHMLKDLCPESQLDAVKIVAGELPLVSLPQGLLETVLRNLVVNALEAGATTVEVFARPDGTIGVRDDGLGVALDKAAKIFGVYSGKLGGAGLGLTLCREILRGRGGNIWLEPPSTFAVRVP
jgi:signal transduction histidine kinase